VRLLTGRPVMIERGAYPDRVGALVAGMDLEKESITERLEELGIRMCTLIVTASPR
jgi:GntR family transcriptional regulator